MYPNSTNKQIGTDIFMLLAGMKPGEHGGGRML